MTFTIWRRARLNALGFIVLLVGIGTGDLLYWLAGKNDQPTDADVLAVQTHSKAYQGEVERNVGAFGALLAQGADALAEPKGLAITIMVVSCVAAGGCFWTASRQPV